MTLITEASKLQNGYSFLLITMRRGAHKQNKQMDWRAGFLATLACIRILQIYPLRIHKVNKARRARKEQEGNHTRVTMNHTSIRTESHRVLGLKFQGHKHFHTGTWQSKTTVLGDRV